VHFRVDALVVRIIHENCSKSNLVKDGEHSGRGVGKKVSKYGFGQREVEVRDF
jgi:hypothetical protein